MLATEIAASHLHLPVNVSLSLYYYCMLVSTSLLVLLKIFFFFYSSLQMVMTWWRAKKRRAGILKWSGMHHYEVHVFWCLLSTEPAGHCNLCPVSAWCDPAQELWTSHRSQCHVSYTLSEKQTRLPVGLGIEPQYFLSTDWNVSVALSIT